MRSEANDGGLSVAHSPWQNPTNFADVDNFDFVAPIDALLIPNVLNAKQGPFSVPDDAVAAAPFLDVNGDYDVSAADYDDVILALASNSTSNLLGIEVEDSAIDLAVLQVNTELLPSPPPTLPSNACALMSVRNTPDVFINHYDIVVDIAAAGSSFTFPEGTVTNTGNGYVFMPNDSSLHGVIARTGRQNSGDDHGSTPISLYFGVENDCNVCDTDAIVPNFLIPVEPEILDSEFDGRGQWAGDLPADAPEGEAQAAPTSGNLTWQDYVNKRQPPQKYAAETHWIMHLNEGGRWASQNTKTSFSCGIFSVTTEAAPDKMTVSAIFDKDESWSIESKETMYLLKHEKLHFKMAEYVAARANQQIAKISGKGFGKDVDQGNATRKAFKDAVANARMRLMDIRGKAERLAQGITDVYDRETEYSRLPDIQSDWDKNWQAKLDTYLRENGW